MKPRREILQGLIVSIGGGSLLNSCGGIAKVALPSEDAAQFYNEEETAWVARISDFIIPRTETPGALDVNVPRFLDGLMAEWANFETQENHRRGIKKIQNQLGKGYLTLSEEGARDLLEDLDKSAFEGRPSEYSEYRSLKSLITQAYFASEDGALLERKWVAVPGRWDPRVEI